MSFRARPSRPDRAKAIAAVALVHAAMATLLLVRPASPDAPPDEPSPVLIDIAPPPPPPPQIEQPAGRTREVEGAAGKKADPTPVVAPPPRIPLATPLPAAPVAGTGSASTSGAAEAGTGPGAGGSGTGRGGGGGGIGAPPRLVSGGLGRRDYRAIRGLMDAGSAGRARLAIMVGADGRVERCSIANSSGNAQVDATLCAIVEPRMRWVPARDTAGNPVRVGVYYIATWQRF